MTWATYEDMIHHPPPLKDYLTVDEGLFGLPVRAVRVCLDGLGSIEAFVDGFAFIERWDLRVDKVVLPEGRNIPSDWWIAREELAFGAEIVHSHLVKPSEVWYMPEDQYLQHGYVACLKPALIASAARG